jgi:hypothetical protein
MLAGVPPVEIELQAASVVRSSPILVVSIDLRLSPSISARGEHIFETPSIPSFNSAPWSNPKRP